MAMQELLEVHKQILEHKKVLLSPYFAFPFAIKMQVAHENIK